MKKDEINLIITISIFSSVILGLLYIWISGDKIDIKNGYNALSIGVTNIVLFWGFYFKWGWKLCLLKNIFYRPNLNGTWAGNLSSDWKNEDGGSINQKTFFVVIRQNFLRINFTTFTDNFIGKSYSETFSLNKVRGIKNVVYLYRKETSSLSNEVMSEGATELRLIESNSLKMEGKYWSNIKTNGIIKIEHISQNHVDSFEDAIKLKN